MLGGGNRGGVTQRILSIAVVFALLAVCTAACAKREYGRPINLLIDEDGTTELEGVRFRQDADLQVKLQELARRNPQPPITILASLKAPPQEVISVLKLLEKDGLMYGMSGEEQYTK
jgi:biopolymer transport protein ExbD